MTNLWLRAISNLLVWAAIFGLLIVLLGVIGGGR